MGAKWFGAAVKRKEDPALLAGKGRFVDDVRPPGTLHAAFVRSPHPHAKIRAVRADAARALAGVRLVLAFADLPEPLRRNALPLFVPTPAITELHLPYALAGTETVYAGEPIAVVVADSRYLAEDAAALVEVDYEPLAGVSNCVAAMEPGSPRAHLGAKSNIAARVPITVGDTDAAFAKAAHVVRERIFIHRGGPFFLECRGLVASYDAVTDAYTVYISSQGSHRIKRGLLDILELNDNQMHVITPDVGGGFGPKGAIYPEYPCVAACARLARPPGEMDRGPPREFSLHPPGARPVLGPRARRRRRGANPRAARPPGPRHRRLRAVGPGAALDRRDHGARALCDPELQARTQRRLHQHDLDHAGARRRPPARRVRDGTDDGPAGAVARPRSRRGAAAQFHHARSRCPTRSASSSATDGRSPMTAATIPPPRRARSPPPIMTASRRARPRRARAGRYLGIGISNAVESTGLGPYEGATVRIATTGKIVLYTGATPQGQSHKTTLAQIAADPLGVSYEDVTVATADTKEIAFGVGTFAARTAVNAGSSAHIAAVEVAKKIKLIAADMMEVSPDDLDLRDGFAEVRGVPGLRKSFREISVKSIGMPGFSMAGGLSPGLENTAYFQPDQSTYSNGTHIAEVEVDIDTGAVKIVRFTVMHDCGTVINPMVVEGQVVGGVAHGIGNALFERLLHDADGQPQTVNFADYLLPGATDMPPIEILHAETPSPLNPLGMKGAGEGGTIPAIAAIIAAVENALAPFGITINEAPISPARIAALVNAARKAQGT